MTIREVSERPFGVATPRAGKIILREAICDACGVTSGERPAKAFPYRKAEAWLGGHKALCSGAPPDVHTAVEVLIQAVRLHEGVEQARRELYRVINVYRKGEGP